MLSNYFVVVGLAVAGLSSAFSAEESNSLLKRTVSPDETCGDVSNGDNNGFTCDPTVNFGGCCSQFGFCGNTTDYCGTGCQPDFGTCDPVPPPVTTPNTFDCGPTNGNLTCDEGLCCSQFGFCGNTTDYCGAGCLSDFGACSTSNISTNEQCGAPNGNTVCPLPECCSASNFCGNTTDYCGDGCQSEFGNCTISSPTGGSGSSNTSTDGLCGATSGNTVCPDSQCCSGAGFCGTTEDYCMDPANCQVEFGRCDSDATPAGPSTIDDPRPLLGSLTYTDDIIDCIEDNVVALSYDDGPYLYTSQLLDILNQTGFHATFFITGNNNGKGEIDITDPYPSLIQRMIADGHQVASHTWSHYSLQNITSAARVQQMVKNEMAFNNIIGKYPTYMRPPYSECDVPSGCQADLQALGYHRIYFDLDTQDYLNPLPTEIQNSKNIVEAALKVRGVTDYLSIQHDIVEQSVTNLTSYYYQQILAKGWKGVTVGECLQDPEENWYRVSPAAASKK